MISFSRVKDHQELLEDRVRVEAYRRAIFRNVRRGDVVMDLGAGTGLLSFFALQAGARRVYAVEKTDMAVTAREAARRMGWADRIVFMRGDVRGLRFPEKADVLLHELVGLYFWEEDMMAAVASARRWLKPRGRIVPRRLDVFMAPARHLTPLEKDVSFWARRPYGLDLSPFAARRMTEGLDDAVRPWDVRLKGRGALLSAPRKVAAVDFSRDAAVPSSGEASFKARPGAVPTGVVAYFSLDLDARTRISTAPWAPRTHWGQVFIPRLERAPVGPSGRIRLRWRPAVKSSRWRMEWDL